MALFRAVENAERPSRRLFEDPYAIPFLSGTLKALAQIAQISGIGKAGTYISGPGMAMHTEFRRGPDAIDR